jgi:CubicO group peptidase (beta-lactamase class C family)
MRIRGTMPTITSPTPSRPRQSAASRPSLRLTALGLAVSLVLAACSAGSNEAAGTSEAAGSNEAAGISDQRSWPAATWESTSPAEAGLDETALADMVSAAEAGGSNCLVVTRDGKLVGDWYWNGHTPAATLEAFSATKSISSTVVGIAADQGLVDIDAPASTWISEWVGTPSEAVTVRQLLSNDSGRFYEFTTDYIDMAIGAPDKTAFAIGLSQQWEPATHWDYNNSAIQTLDAVVSRATGMATTEFATENLFAPIGSTTVMKSDPSGNTLTFMGAETTCLDLARFGLLFARDGEWAGRQVVSPEWVAEATTPSQDLNPGYGFLWWLTGGSASADPDGTGASDDQGVPSNTFAALGLGGQIVLVDPSTDTVVVRMARLGNEDFGVDDLGAWLSRADAGS